MLSKVDYKYMDDPMDEGSEYIRTFFNVISVDTKDGCIIMKIFEDGRQKTVMFPTNNIRFMFVTPGDVKGETK